MKRKDKLKNKTIESSGTLPLLELQYNDPLFAMALHPSEPLIVTGLATGHVQLQKYSLDGLGKETEIVSPEKHSSHVTTLWQTKRHKKSCRAALFGTNGNSNSIFTIGKDNVIKKADIESGKVQMKRNISDDIGESGLGCAVLSSSHSHLVTGDELGNIFVFDTNDKMKKVWQLNAVHDDMVNQIVQIPNATSAYHYLSVGSTTVAKIDLRKGVLHQSENQEDEVLSVCFEGDQALCGMGSGVVTHWKESKNLYADQLSRTKVSKDDSVDCVVNTMKDDGNIWSGASDGSIYLIDSKGCKVIEKRVHDEVDEVNMLDIDCEYRMVSAGMSGLKIWGDGDEANGNSDDNTDDNSDNSDNDKSDFSDSDNDSFSESGEDEISDNEPKPPVKKQKIAKSTSQEAKQKLESKQKPKETVKPSKKQIKNTKKVGKPKNPNGIAKFDL